MYLYRLIVEETDEVILLQHAEEHCDVFHDIYAFNKSKNLAASRDEIIDHLESIGYRVVPTEYIYKY